jgi:hypothetical protein
MRIFNPAASSGGEIGATGAQGPQGPGGGGGAGGLMFYLNQNTSPDSTTGLPTTSSVVTGFAVKELGRIADTVQTTITTEHLPINAFNLVAGFVSDVQDPSITTIPPGLWDLNFWASSTANANNQTVVQVKAYVYNGTTLGAPFAISDELYIYDPTVVAQYTANLVVGAGVTITSSDRIYIEIWAKGSSNNYTLTLKFGAGTPTHLHTTIPSVSGTGLMKIVDGLPQTPASLIVNADIATNAAIAISKVNLNYFNLSMNVPVGALETIPRNRGFSTWSTVSGQIFFTMFTPIQDIEVNYLSFLAGNVTPTASTVTVGIYSYNDSTGDATKLTETANISGSITQNAFNLKPISYVKLMGGNRYAVGFFATGGTQPSLAGYNSGYAPVNDVSPAIARKSFASSYSSLPVSINLNSDGAQTGNVFWARLSTS